MRKIAVITMLFILCFNSLGYFIVHEYAKQKIKKEIKTLIKQQVPDEELVVFLLDEQNAGEFQWIHSREFRHNGTMYDVVRVEVISETTRKLHCVTDHQETRLFKNLHRMVSNTMQSNPANPKVLNLLSQIMSNLYQTELTDFTAPQNFFVWLWPEMKQHYVSPCIILSSPPPKA